MKFLWNWAACAVLLFASMEVTRVSAQVSLQQAALPANPLTATIHIEDAQRFAHLFAVTDGKPTAEQIQKDYLAGASYGVTVFTPNRIESASHLASAVASKRDDYAAAIQKCLPNVQAYDADLRSIYLALHGLLPNEPLPQIYVVFGSGNSGGTAGSNAQVLGLEVLCKASGGTPAGLRSTMRRFFAHETVHTFQSEPAEAQKSPLLAAVLTEGGADFIASIVTGEVPEPDRERWALQKESFLWSEFQKDLIATQPASAKVNPKSSREASLRWVGNYGIAPPGWPYEVGYWMGMRIWQCYYQKAPNKQKAILDVLSWNDPEAVLQWSGYNGSGCGVEALQQQASQ